MKLNRALFILLLIPAIFAHLHGIAQSTIPTSQKRTLCVQFKEGANPRLRMGDGGRVLTCIAAVDSLNQIYGCNSVESRFRFTKLKSDDPHGRDFYFHFRTGIDVNALRIEYMKTGSFANILLDNELWLGEEPGWSGRVRETTGVNKENSSSNSLPNLNNKVLYVKFKGDAVISIHTANDGTPYVGLEAVDAISSHFGCKAIGKRFKGKTARKDYDADKSYIFVFKEGIDVYLAREMYLATGAFESIEIAKNVSVTGGATGFIPNDPRYPKQWALNNDSVTVSTQFPTASVKLGADMNMEAAWDCEQGDTTVIAAILDSGCKTDHPDLEGRLWTNYADDPNDNLDNDGNGYTNDIHGWDFRHDDNTLDDIDPAGHGTGIAALVGADGDNGQGISGVDLKCRLMILKFVDTLSSAIDPTRLDSAIRYAVDNGASVINFSYTFPTFDAIIHDAILYAHDNNVQFVSISGNGNVLANNLYPAAYPDSLGILIVGSTDPDDGRSSTFVTGGGSNWTDFMDVCAPGNYIQVPDNLTNSEYYWVGGTSAAAAHVTGLYTLLKAQDPNRSVDSIAAIIKRTADDQVGNPLEDTQGHDPYHGFGRVNAERALCGTNAVADAANSQVSLSVFPNPSSGRVTATIANVTIKTAKVRVHDIHGRLVLAQDFNAGQQITIDLPPTNGLYMVEMVVNDRLRGVAKVLRIEY